jgi:hypothetical protein
MTERMIEAIMRKSFLEKEGRRSGRRRRKK